MFPSAIAALLLGAVTVAPATVPGRGHQEAIVTADAAGMVHLQTAGTKGTRCEVVDHLRGPFATAGVAGHAPCALDLLLDAGTYKVRLDSRAKETGQLTVKATPFTELNHDPVTLAPGDSTTVQLHAGNQASYWMRIDTRQFVTLRVAGRTAGQVELWRDGHWREETGATDAQPAPVPDQKLHEWWIGKFFEAGDYLLTVYGVNAELWTKGHPSDEVTISRGFPPGAPGHSQSFTLPHDGLAGITLGSGNVTAVLSLPAAVSTPTLVQLYTIADDGSVDFTRGAGTCTVQVNALVPECVSSAAGKGLVALIRGAPGTAVRLQWLMSSPNAIGDGRFGLGTDIDFQTYLTGRYVVGTVDLPPDVDSLPLSCELQREDYPGSETFVPVASDFLEVGKSKPFQRSFNFNRSSDSVWFKVVDSTRFDITTTGGHVKGCELYRVYGGRSDRQTQTRAGSAACDESLSLAEGEYRLDYGDSRGIEKLRIAASGAAQEDTSTKSGCLLTDVVLNASLQYRLALNRKGDVATRGLFIRQQALTLDDPLPLTLDNQSFVRIPVAPGAPIEIFTTAGNLSCGMADGHPVDASHGVCRPPGSEAGGLLVLTPHGSNPVNLMIARSRPPAPPQKLADFTPHPLEPPVLPVDRPMYFDFGQEESHSLVFDVKEAGLYDVTTEGLLATQCTMRTAAVTSLGSNSSGGRGRNCLLEQYLRPGRYLVTAQTLGKSKGRAAVVLRRRLARTVPAVTADGESFFRADAGELIQQSLTVTKKDVYSLSTTDRGIPNTCRLEDSDGWPLLAVPMECSRALPLESGHYIWMQLPLTVESMRHTKLEAEKPHVVFRGKKVHAVAFNEWRDAVLRKDGKDEYFINLQADADLNIALTNRMQGRLYFINPDKSLKPVDIIPPADTGGAPAPQPATPDDATTGDDATPNDATPDADGAPEADEGDTAAPAEPAEGDEGDGENVTPSHTDEGDESTETPPPPPRTGVPGTPVAAGGMPPGHQVHLPAGPYKLIAVHSQGDVAIRYRLFVGSETLLPGTSRTLMAPTYVTVRVPQNGTLRLSTAGETDVRCRIFDSAGRLVTQTDHKGEDWNCALAEPFSQGDYKLVIESETLAPGETKVSVSMPEVQDVGALASGATLKIGAAVVVGTIPPLTGDAVQEIGFRSPDPVSCALEDPSGAVLGRKLNVTDCTFLLRPAIAGYRARIWTLDRPVQVAVTIAAQKIVAHDDGRSGVGEAARTVIQSASRYATSEHASCLLDGQRGLLRDCGGTVSLESGPYVFAASSGASLNAPLREIPLTVDDRVVAPDQLTRLPSIQRQQSSGKAIQLLRVSAAAGEHDAPACAIKDGARALLPTSCIAASRVGSSAIERWWAPTNSPLAAEVFHAVAPIPSAVSALDAGQRTLTWSGHTARYSLPTSHVYRLALMLPPDGWALRLEPDGSVADLCAAGASITRCVLSGRGGELVLYAPAESRADALLVVADAPPAPATLTTVAEEVLPGPASLHYDIPPAATPRVIRVEGAAHCLTILSDGSRTSGCEAPLPAQLSAQLLIELDGGAFRASVGSAEKPEEARFGGALRATNAEWLPWSQATVLTGALVDRSFSLTQEGIVHLRADSGVCALLSGTEFLQVAGFGGSCEIDRLLGPGSYRLVVRPFGRVALAGTVVWTTEGVEALSDGVGSETWLAGGGAKLYRFTTASAGKVGVGLQVPADTLQCTVLDASQHLIGTGCQQYLTLDAGRYVLAVRAPSELAPTNFRPVLLGLAGAQMGVPEDYLRDFFKRIGEAQ